MYKIPANINFDRFKGKTLTSMTFGINLVVMHFSNDDFVQFDGSFSINKNGKKESFDEVYPAEKTGTLLSLLEKEIARVEVNDERTILTFIFDNGDSLALIDDAHYESFSLFIDGKEIIV